MFRCLQGLLKNFEGSFLACQSANQVPSKRVSTIINESRKSETGGWLFWWGDSFANRHQF